MQSANPSIISEKVALRQVMGLRLRTLSSDQRIHKSAEICRLLKESLFLKSARIIAVFDPLREEPDISPLSTGADQQFAFPRVQEGGLAFYCPNQPAVADNLRAHNAGMGGRHGVREPDPSLSRFIPESEIDLALVPGLAFSPSGRRLGRGGGFYDRWLASLSHRAPRIGVCFATQMVAKMPSEAHDMKVDHVVTEEGWVKC
ncbi:MAG: 5-formyltetrahydrofolate cyclo-ligase [Verrucomicrobiales bacterium]